MKISSANSGRSGLTYPGLKDESDPNQTVSHLESLNSDEEVVAYLGGFGSSLHAAAAATGYSARMSPRTSVG